MRHNAVLQASNTVLAPEGRADSKATVRDWVDLLKPRVVVLVMFTGIVGLLLAPGHLDPRLGFAAILAIVAGAGSAGAVNMWYDRDIDGVMKRTSGRPIPAGKIPAHNVLAFGIILAFSSVILMFLATNLIAAGLLVASIVFYVVVYTMWLKRRTPLNIVIGGAAGAFPPVIGWLAVSGTLTLFPILMFAIVFLWTPPHFWALSLYAHSDYEEAAIPMLPVIRGQRSTRLQIFVYTVFLVAISLLPWMLGEVGVFYGVFALGLGCIFIALAYQVYLDQDKSGRSLLNNVPARKTFGFSLLYLFLLFGMLTIDNFLSVYVFRVKFYI